MEKSVFNFVIQKDDDTFIDLHDLNLFVNSFRIISPTPEHVTERVDGRAGSVLLETNLLDRRITAKITVESKDYEEFDSFKSELFKIFNPLEKFYIIRDLQPGKRLEVSVASEFDIDYIWLELGEFQIDFVIHSVYLESCISTLSPYNSYQVSTNGSIGYRFKENTFSVWNDGDITVDPRVFPLIIEFRGTSNNLTIRNLTTGDEWKYNGSTIENDIVTLDGIRSFKNGFSIFRDTNRKLISLKNGQNQFEVVGATSPFEISFDFRFYYI